MPLGAREVLIAIRARDVTSRVLREIGNNFSHLSTTAAATKQSLFNTGAALTAIGVGMAGIGAVGLKFFSDSVDSFIEYSRQAALTRTQVDDLGVSVSQIAEIGERVASKIPAPFDEMQDALFDIFSSMDVNLKEAEGLLELFAKGAVAGQTDIRTAARSTIAVMNAYKLPFTDASEVMDIMFEMVRKGVGTYEEFNVAIGRAIPAAVSASQEFDTLAAVMAFLTRQGLSTQMAATSAARAMELFTKPDVVESLRAIGVEVTDAHGNFRQLNDIILDVANSEGWAKMGAADRKKMFQDIFGTGTIQARRFFDTAIPNFRDLNTLTEITSSSAGELGIAYQTMFEEPAMKAQLLANKYAILKEEIGEKLLPAKLELIETVSKLLDWWNSLSDGTQTLIVRIAAGTAAFMAIAGAVITAIGVFAMVTAIIGPVGITMATLLGIITGIGAAIAAAVVAFRLLGGGIRGIIGAVSAAILAFIAMGTIWGAIATSATFALTPLIVIIGAIAAAALAAVVIWKNWDTVKNVIDRVVEAIKAAWQWFSNLSLAGKILIGIVLALVAPFVLVVAAVVALVRNFDSVVDAAKGTWEWFNNLHMAGKILIGIFTAMVAPFLLVIAAGVAIAKNWSTVVQWADNLVKAAKGLWEWFTGLSTVFKVIAGVVLAIVAPFIAAGAALVAMGKMIISNWDSIKNVAIAVWSTIVSVVDSAWALLKTFWNWLTNIDVDIWGGIKDATITTWNTIKNVVSTTIDTIGSAISGAANAIMMPISFLWGLLKEGFDWFSDNFGDQFAEIWDTAFTEVGNIIEELGETFSVLGDQAGDFAERVGVIAGYVGGFFSEVGKVAGEFASVFAESVGPVISDAFDVARAAIEFFMPSWDLLVDGVTQAVKVVTTVLKTMAAIFATRFMAILSVVRTVFGIIVGAIQAAVNIILSVWENFSGIFLSIAKDAWTIVSSIIVMSIKIISNVIQFFLNLIQGDWGEAWQNIKNILAAVWDGIISVVSSVINTLLTLVGDLPGAIVSFVGDLFGIMFELGKDIINGLIDGAKAIWDSLLQLGKDIFNGVVDTIKNIFGIGSPSTVMMEIGKDIIRGLWNGIKAIWRLAADWFDERKDKVLEVFANAGTWLYETGKSLLRGLWNGIKWLWDNSIFGWFSARKQKFLDFFSNAISWLTEVGKNVLRGLWNGIKTIWDISIAGWFTGSNGGGGISGKFKGFFTNAINWLKSAGKNIIEGLKSGIKSVVDNIKDWIGDRVDDIIDAFKDFFGISSPSTVMMEVGKNFIFGFMRGVVTAAKNIPALIGKIGMGIVDLMKYLGMNIFGEVMVGEVGTGFIQNIMKQMAAEVGWTGAQWEALAKLVQSESGFNPNAQNPTSSAYGLFQFLDSTWGSVGFAKTSDPIKQILAGFAYIKNRYGNPLNAWNFWQSHSPHWYEKGAWNVPYTGLAGLHQGEMVIPRTFASQLRDAMSGSGGRGANFNFYGDVTFGSDMGRATNDLDFWARTQQSGV